MCMENEEGTVTLTGWVLTRHSLDGDDYISIADYSRRGKTIGESGWIQLYPSKANAESYARMLQARDSDYNEDFWFSTRKATLTFKWSPDEEDLVEVE